MPTNRKQNPEIDFVRSIRFLNDQGVPWFELSRVFAIPVPLLRAMFDLGPIPIQRTSIEVHEKIRAIDLSTMRKVPRGASTMLDAIIKQNLGPVRRARKGSVNVVVRMGAAPS